jgi:hypothetical protein
LCGGLALSAGITLEQRNTAVPHAINPYIHQDSPAARHEERITRALHHLQQQLPGRRQSGVVRCKYHLLLLLFLLLLLLLMLLLPDSYTTTQTPAADATTNI